MRRTDRNRLLITSTVGPVTRTDAELRRMAVATALAAPTRSPALEHRGTDRVRAGGRAHGSGVCSSPVHARAGPGPECCEYDQRAGRQRYPALWAPALLSGHGETTVRSARCLAGPRSLSSRSNARIQGGSMSCSTVCPWAPPQLHEGGYPRRTADASSPSAIADAHTFAVAADDQSRYARGRLG